MSIAALPESNAVAPDSGMPAAVLAMRNVGKGFGSGYTRTDVLKGINLELYEGEFLAIVGFSGIGCEALIKFDSIISQDLFPCDG